MDFSKDIKITSFLGDDGAASVRQVMSSRFPEDEEPKPSIDLINHYGGITVSVKNEFATGESDGGLPQDLLELEGTPRLVRLGSSIGRSSTAASITTSFAEDLEARFAKFRHEVIREDGGINTPLYVLREMAREYGTPIHFEFHEVHITKYLKRYVVEVYVGRLKGLGEASRRKLAMHIAAADLLEKMRVQNGGTFQIPEYALLPGCRINPTIFGELQALCLEFNLDTPMFVEMPIDPEVLEPPRFMYKCQIGQLFVEGFSDSRYLAKRWAAKKLFEALTGETVPMEPVAHGGYCFALDQFKIKPKISNQKLSVLKFREESRLASGSPGVRSAATDTGAQSECEDEGEEGDDFDDALDTDCAKPEPRPKRSASSTIEIKERLADLNLLGRGAENIPCNMEDDFTITEPVCMDIPEME